MSWERQPCAFGEGLGSRPNRWPVSNQPLEKATSASLEALQTGAEGTKLFLAGDPQAALPLYQRGIELDPDLALTYEGIGMANGALGHYDLMAASVTRAYQLRDRMMEKDRLNAEY